MSSNAAGFHIRPDANARRRNRTRYTRVPGLLLSVYLSYPRLIIYHFIMQHFDYIIHCYAFVVWLFIICHIIFLSFRPKDLIRFLS